MHRLKAHSVRNNSVANNAGLFHSFSRCCLPNMRSSAKFRENLNLHTAVHGHPRYDFGTNRKRICDFLLVINSNFGPILHRFWDTATYWLTIAYFSYPSLIRRPAPYVPYGISRWS